MTTEAEVIEGDQYAQVTEKLQLFSIIGFEGQYHLLDDV